MVSALSRLLSSGPGSSPAGDILHRMLAQDT